MAKRSCLAIILAAGEGTRMKSAVPKVLHKVGGLPMLGHVLKAAAGGGAAATAVVIGPRMETVAAFVAAAAPWASLHRQGEPLGTAHAVLAAKSAIAKGADDMVVVYGDTPMVTAKTLARVRRSLAAGADIALVGFRPASPTGYGRLIVEEGQVVAIREEKDATPAQRAIGFCSGSILAFRGAILLPTLKKVRNDNAKGEYYLTDAVEIANAARRKVVAVEVDADEVAGINSRRQLAHVEGIFQRQAREAAMREGATLIAPSTVWFSHDTKVGRDVIIEPNVFFGPGVTIADGVTIRANCHIEGARIASGAIIGPFARLRPGTKIGPNVHIGDFVEVKNATIDDGAKANHLAYIGDAHVGARANVGAGTITANYDGFAKHHTEIGSDASTGSNSVLVAPVIIGAGAYVAAGSVITHNVPAEALAIARGRQMDKPGWARRYRELKGVNGNPGERKSR
ncbi:MAG: bifunctional UDP-N-acetylglucosamine diphosphorylase/glucosamine-1-phosphate N-acetyltransferase GlmU [Bauldia sp.]